MADYYYIHETPNVLYTVEAKPPPADSSKAVFHANSPAGKTLHSEPALKKSGQGSIPFPLKSKGIKVGDSPIFVEFTFEKAGAKPPTVKRLVVLALAEPAVRTIEAPPEAAPDEPVKLVVTAWSALVYEKPGSSTLWPEEKPARISTEDRSKVKWKLAGKDLTVEGDKIRTGGIKKDHLGTWVEAEAWLGEKPDPRLHATAAIAVPLLVIEGPVEVEVDQAIGLVARIAPSIPGSYAWKGGEKRVRSTPDGSVVSVAGVEASEQALDVTIECTFTSEATKKTYKAEHKLTVVGKPELELAAEHEEPPALAVEDDVDEDPALEVEDETEEPELAPALDIDEDHVEPEPPPEILVEEDVVEPEPAPELSMEDAVDEPALAPELSVEDALLV